MNEQKFKEAYLCEFKPDPVLLEIVEFLRYADAKEISKWRREGLFDARLLREAKRLLQEERKFAKEVK